MDLPVRYSFHDRLAAGSGARVEFPRWSDHYCHQHPGADVIPDYSLVVWLGPAYGIWTLWKKEKRIPLANYFIR